MSPRTAGMADVQRELGRLAEAVENAKTDRTELKQAVEKFGDYVNELRGSVNALNQTVQSMAAQIVAINNDKCGARLDVVEEKMKRYDRIVGTGMSMIVRVVLILLASAVFGGTAATYAAKFL